MSKGKNVSTKIDRDTFKIERFLSHPQHVKFLTPNSVTEVGVSRKILARKRSRKGKRKSKRRRELDRARQQIIMK
jgi:hypothetical protein